MGRRKGLGHQKQVCDRWIKRSRLISGSCGQKRSDAVATATLVNSDIEIGRRIVGALTRAGIPVSIYLWAFVPQLEEWQFMIATPFVDTKGPLSAYGEVNKALQKEGIFEDTPLRRIFLKSPSDPVLKSLEKQSRAVP